MKKKNKIIISILILSLILGIAAFQMVFAGGGGGGGDDKPTVDNVLMSGNVTTTAKGVSRFAQGKTYYDYNDNWLKSYVLAVSTGAEDGEVDSIIITYTTTAAGNGNENALTVTSQILKPSEGYINSSNNAMMVSSEYNSATQSTFSTSQQLFKDYLSPYRADSVFGSRFTGYEDIYGAGIYYNDSSNNHLWDVNGRYYGVDNNQYKATYLYSKWIKNIVYGTADYLDDYTAREQIESTDKSTYFTPYSTEYIRFTAKTDIVEILDVTFVLSGQGSGAWSLNGWKLFELQDWVYYDSVVGSNNQVQNNSIWYVDGGVTSTYTAGYPSSTSIYNGYVHDWTIIPYAVKFNGPKLTTYALMSDRVGMFFDGTLIAQSQDYHENAGVGFEAGIDIVRFTSNKDVYNLVVYSESKETYTASTRTKAQQAKLGYTFNWENQYYYDNLGTGQNAIYKMANSGSVNGYTVGKKYSMSSTTLNFSINIADIYGSGIDSFIGGESSDGVMPREVLYATIYYTNTWGYKECVKVPVITNMLLEYILDECECWTENGNNKYYNLLLNKGLTAIAQQGDSLIFSVEFPNFSSLDSMDLDYDNSVDSADYFVVKDVTVYEDKSNGQRGNYLTKVENKVTGKDDAGNETVTQLNQGQVLLAIPSDCNMLYRSTLSSQNTILDAATTYCQIDFESVSTAKVAADDYANKYLVTLKTSNVQTAGTLSDIYAQFFYLTADGKEAATQEVSLFEASSEFYGFLPGKVDTESTTKKDYSATVWYDTFDWLQITHKDNTLSGELKPTTVTGVDTSYIHHMQQGATIQFYITASNLDKFTGVTFRNDDTYDDNWQLDSITIQDIDSVGVREINNIGSKTIDNISYRFDVSRSVLGTVLYSKSGLDMLVDSGSSVSYSLEDSSISGEQTVRDYSDYWYSMSYEIASSDLHFDEAAKNYEIKVKVAGTENSLRDDGCGSNNLFYFQLVFKNGSSAFVLANQQLAADGFRTGAEENFTICVNEDFGDLVAINIIPDDTTEDAQRMDKLNIEYIEVTKINVGSVSKLYRFDNVGWIKAEYEDRGGQEDSEGRSAAELMQSFPVSSSAYILNLEVTFAWGEYPEHQVVNETTEKVETVKYPQFVGDMYIDITYINSNNESKTTGPIKMVDLMYTYNNMTHQMYAGATGAAGTKSYQSDSSWMFRENTYDRFTIRIDDAVTLKSITIKGNPDDNTYLNLAGINISILKSDGRLRINTNGEYQVDYDVDPASLVSSVTRSLPENFYFAANKWTNYTFVFGSNQMPSFEGETTLNTIISRVPDSVNDTLDMYLYMSKNAIAPSSAGKPLTTKIYYSAIATGRNYITETTKYTEETAADGTIVLKALGLSATNMTMLSDMTISADSQYEGAYIDHAVIQQVRSGTVINTYYINFIGTNAASRLGISMGSKSDADDSTGETQRVTLRLNSATSDSKLKAEDYDMAVALMYTSSLGTSDKVLTSPYVYLTDSGANTISPNGVVSFDFKEAYVGNIVGIKVASVNKLAFGIDGAVVESFITSGDSITRKAYYSIDKQIETVNGILNLDVTTSRADSVDTLKLATFKIKSTENPSVMDSAYKYPISMKIAYLDVLNTMCYETIEDIKTFASSDSSFKAGGEATIQIFLPGVKEICYVDFAIDPESEENPANRSWNIDSIKYNVQNTEYVNDVTVSVNRTLYGEGDDNIINLRTVAAKVTVTGLSSSRVLSNNEISMDAQGGEVVNLKINITGTVADSSYTYKVEKVVNGSTTTVVAESKKTEDKLAYSIEKNDSKNDVKYIFTIASVENPKAKSVLNVTVPAKAE